MNKRRRKKVEWMLKPRWQLKRDMTKRLSKNLATFVCVDRSVEM
jgi:hypothetical protein